MIQIYIPSNTNYEMNGDATLQPLSCEASFILNSTWELVLENIVDDNFSLINENAVISAPTPYGKKQKYRIYNIIKNMSGITAYARPIFLDAKNDCFLYDVRPTNKNGQDALNSMITNKKYSASSNITKVSTSYFVNKNLIEAINENDENSFINRWGGEIAYNDYQIIINERLGADKGLRAEFGFNLKEIEEQIDMSNVVTRIIPIAYNGIMLPDQETIDSPNIDKYPIVYQKVIAYEDVKLASDAQDGDAENGITICNTLNDVYEVLRTRAKAEYVAGIDKPAITYTIDVVDLSKTDMYKQYAHILTANLGDTVHCKHKRLGIETEARVIQLNYDCITEKITSLVLGDFEKNYFTNSSSILNAAGTVINTNNNTLMAEKIQGIINMLSTSLKAQKNIAQKQDVRAILFEDIDPDSPTFGALSIGTKGIQIAGARNETNTDWQWGTAIDFRTIYAQFIVAGILSDKLGNNYWDLDKGEFVSNTGKFRGLLDGATFKSSKTTQVTYTSDDLTALQNHILNDYVLTDEQFEKYDLDCSGTLNTGDTTRMALLLGDASSVTVDVVETVEINSENANTVKITKKIGSLAAIETTIEGSTIFTNQLMSHYLNLKQTDAQLQMNPIWMDFVRNLSDGGKSIVRFSVPNDGDGFILSFSKYDSTNTRTEYNWLTYNSDSNEISTNISISTNGDVYAYGTVTAKEFITR